MAQLNRRHLLTIGLAGGTLAAANALVNAPAVHASTFFEDVPNTHPFRKEIDWMYFRGISTGWEEPGRSWVLYYRPYENVARNAMAAFLYRLSGKPAYTAPARSPFRDVRPGDQFYTEMCWLRQTGITTGWPDGTFRPLWSINRDAMAAFLYRLAGSPRYTPYKRSPFRDVRTTDQFYKEICWMRDTGISTGYDDGTYRPLEPVKRDAMAAFLYRYSENHNVLWPWKITYRDVDGSSIYFKTVVTSGGYTYRDSPYLSMRVGNTRAASFKVPKNAGVFTCGLGLDVNENAIFDIKIMVDGREVFKRTVNHGNHVPVKVDVRGKSSVHVVATATRKINASDYNSWGGLVIGDAAFDRE